MTLAQIQAILNSTTETPLGKTILILQLASDSLSAHANELSVAIASFDNTAELKIINAMRTDASNMLAVAKAAATAPSAPTM